MVNKHRTDALTDLRAADSLRILLHFERCVPEEAWEGKMGMKLLGGLFKIEL